jgi:hypothetical protein
MLQLLSKMYSYFELYSISGFLILCKKKRQVFSIETLVSLNIENILVL